MKRKMFLFFGVLTVVGGIVLFLHFRSASRNAPLLTLELEETSVFYSEVTELEDGGQMQIVFLGDPEDQNADALGVSVYPNPDRLTAEEWIRQEWDPQGLMVLENFSLPMGNAVLIKDINTWADTQRYLVEFPTLVVISVENRIITADQLSGVVTSPERILQILTKGGR